MELSVRTTDTGSEPGQEMAKLTTTMDLTGNQTSSDIPKLPCMASTIPNKKTSETSGKNKRSWDLFDSRYAKFERGYRYAD